MPETKAGPTNRPLIIGVGNALRGDDGIGLEIVRRLRQRSLAADFAEAKGDATSLVQAWNGRSRVIAIDAAELGKKPGFIGRIDVTCDELPESNDVSSHGFGLAQAVELARALDRLPAHFIVFAVQGESFEQGDGLSLVLEKEIPRIEHCILRELQGRQREQVAHA